MQKRILIIVNIIILIIFFSNTLYSADESANMFNWMLLPVSARGAGIGQGVVAIVDNANTVFWNPGGVGFLDDNLCINYSYNPLSGLEYWSFRDEFHTFAVNTKISKNIVTGLNYKYIYHGYLFTFKGNKIKDYSIGALFNYKKGNIGFGINTNLYSFSEWVSQNNHVLSFDLGALYSKDLNKDTPSYIKNISFGISILNISPDVKDPGVITYKLHFNDPGVITYKLPYNLRIGYCITLVYPKGMYDKHPFIVTHNLEYSDVLNTKKVFSRNNIGGGIEFLLYKLFYIRLGYHNRNFSDLSIKGITYGTGLIFPLKFILHNLNSSITYDFAMYAWKPDSNGGKNEYYPIHSFGFKYNF